MNIALVANPLSGNYNKDTVDNFIFLLGKSGFIVSQYMLEQNQKIEEIITKLNPELTPIIVLMAGDGTINNALNALVNRNDYEKFSVAVAPMGTANVLSLELGVGTTERALKAMENGKIKKLHMGKIIKNSETGEEEDWYFMLMVSAGFDSIAVNHTNEKLKKKIGGLAYLYEFFKILINRNIRELETTVDGVVHKNILTCVSNGKYYGVEIPITGSKIEENNFDVVIIKKISIWSALKYMFTKRGNDNIIKLTGKNYVAINAIAEDYPIQIDGDYHCNLPVRVESSDKYINVYYL